MPPETGCRRGRPRWPAGEHRQRAAAPASEPQRHLALLAPDGPALLTAIAEFVLTGITSGQPVLIALTAERAAAAREVLGSHPPSVWFADLADIGRNPARIIPALQCLSGEADRPVRVVTEPLWPGRTEAETREVLRHEALVNRALTGSSLALLCVYDTAALPAPVLAEVRRTHPLLADDGRSARNDAYAGPGVVPALCEQPLEPVPPGAETLSYRHDLAAVREQVARRAAAAGLSPARCTDLVLAVSEIMANTLRAGAGPGSVRLWTTPAELICQIRDAGQIGDPRAGRLLPDPHVDGGRGLWLVNQYCDLAEVRSGPGGTTFRLHMRRAPGTRQARPGPFGSG